MHAYSNNITAHSNKGASEVRVSFVSTPDLERAAQLQALEQAAQDAHQKAKLSELIILVSLYIK